MINLELQTGKRTKLYRFFEIVPAILSYGAVIILIVLSFVSPLWAAVYLLAVIITMAVKAVGIAVQTISGRNRFEAAQRIDWHARLMQFENPADSYVKVLGSESTVFGDAQHKENLRLAAADPAAFPLPSRVFNAIIIATYNESFDVLDTTLQSIVDTTYDKDHLIMVITYEERGGSAIAETVQALEVKYANVFKKFITTMHPDGIEGEVMGKGPNITHGARVLQKWIDEQKDVEYKDVIITTLDSDNRPHKTYFDYVTYEFIAHEDRKHLSYQPIALYFGNIWDAPAPMRVIATGNSFWTIISSMRPHTLRNFAAHSQPMEALVEMDYWSCKSIVEDGHQYWRSYFYFGGNYSVLPIHVPVYQDAVMSETLKKTLIAQFKQLRRWGYGVSDIPYVATRVFSRTRNVPFFAGFARLIRLIDSHVTLASTALLVTFGGWVPLLVNSDAARNIAAHQLPEVVSMIQRVAMVGLFITIFLSMKMLPPRPERYKRSRNIGMLLQWLLMPVTSVIYNSIASFNAQTHLALGKYLDKFDVTDKATIADVDRARQAKVSRRGAAK